METNRATSARSIIAGGIVIVAVGAAASIASSAPESLAVLAVEVPHTPVWQGSEANVTWLLMNHTAAPVRITKVTGDCACTSITVNLDSEHYSVAKDRVGYYGPQGYCSGVDVRRGQVVRLSVKTNDTKRIGDKTLSVIVNKDDQALPLRTTFEIRPMVKFTPALCMLKKQPRTLALWDIECRLIVDRRCNVTPRHTARKTRLMTYDLRVTEGDGQWIARGWLQCEAQLPRWEPVTIDTSVAGLSWEYPIEITWESDIIVARPIQLCSRAGVLYGASFDIRSISHQALVVSEVSLPKHDMQGRELLSIEAFGNGTAHVACFVASVVPRGGSVFRMPVEIRIASPEREVLLCDLLCESQ
jgi:hypothetical protein